MFKTIYDLPEHIINQVVRDYQTEYKFSETLLSVSVNPNEIQVNSGRFNASINSNWHDGDKIDIEIVNFHITSLSDFSNIVKEARRYFNMVIVIKAALEGLVRSANA